MLDAGTPASVPAAQAQVQVQQPQQAQPPTIQFTPVLIVALALVFVFLIEVVRNIPFLERVRWTNRPLNSDTSMVLWAGVPLFIALTVWQSALFATVYTITAAGLTLIVYFLRRSWSPPPPSPVYRHEIGGVVTTTSDKPTADKPSV